MQTLPEMSFYAPEPDRQARIRQLRALENPPADWEDCGCCGGTHPAGYTGDCRDDANRWPA